MWKRIKDTQYFILFSKEHGYEICITDYLSVWTTIYSEKAFLAQLKESNEGLDLQDDNEFVKKGVHLLSNLQDMKKFRLEKNENGKSLYISMTISFGFPFYFECTLSKGSEELYFQKVTRPLLKIICDLRESQTELRHLLIKKDSEIEEYKCEGGEIVLRHLKTIAFNDEEHMKKHKVYEENFGASNKSILEEAVAILEKNVLKQEPNVTANPVIKTKPIAVVKTEPNLTVKTEPNSTVKIEPNLTIKTETNPVGLGSVSIKTEPILVLKEEPKAEVSVEPNVPVITASVKQEVKRETVRAHIPRKRSKFNF